MTLPPVAAALTVLGIAIWALAIRSGPSFAYGDVQARYRLILAAGAACFALAAILVLVEALST